MNLTRREILTAFAQRSAALAGVAAGTLGWAGTALGSAGTGRGDTPAQIAWLTWPAGLQRAAAEHKAMGLFVYADWCPHCRELEPLFRDPEIVRAARGLVMVRHNADEVAPWLRERFGRFGTYVPRLFFLHPDGAMAEEIQSGNPKFPYFYQPTDGEQLRGAMRRATALAAR